ncbi:MAG: GNAT family N-acetyltransferase [Roseovarius sp.]|nr:GNAT family N-acetyltransferase [Roseovarius sp.]MCY4291723.1 GNAT family N-acetyltransferase [Roseovarius sp.]MCY4315230.1 GNAT family N-acetyltransferase [Roseovarius sp.]
MFRKGRYRVRIARNANDIKAAQELRYMAFAPTEIKNRIDCDEFDRICTHFLVEEVATGHLVCCFRMMYLENSEDIGLSYSAQYYELSALKSYTGKMAEVGRFCIHPELNDPDILRAAWAAMTKTVDENDIDLLFGCSSFKGTDERDYLDSFAVLKDRHLAPRRWLPRVKSPLVFKFAHKLRLRKPDIGKAMAKMPPLLKTYLLMGGWVSDHAVVDSQMNTLHVFTGLEINAIPPARKRLLRATAK